MRLASKALAAALVAGSIPLFAGSVAAAPIGQSLALKHADASAIEQVQYRRRGGYWRGGRWIGPAAGFAAGVAIGSVLAPRVYDDGYYAYGAAPGYVEPGYVYQPAPRYDRAPRNRCGLDQDTRSAYPSWMC